MRFSWTAVLLVLGAPCLGQDGPGPGRVARPVAQEADYSLHEWGVFPIARNADWAMVDLLAEWKTFPPFFHGTLPERKLAYRGPVSKPVIWLHTSEPLRLELQVTFAEGRPLIWWPSAEEPSKGGLMRDHRRLRFSLGVNQCYERGSRGNERPRERWPSPPEVPVDHWVNTLRAVDSARVFTQGSHGLFTDDMCSDSFVYYDGVMKAPSAPRVQRTATGLLLRTELDHAALDAWCIERRDGELWVSDWFEMAEGAVETAVPLRRCPDPAAAIARARGTLISRAVKAGLNPDEAIALGEVWDEGFFQQPGLSVLYRIPPETYERWLPLSVKPRPRETVRVGIVLHRRLEPELEAQVKALLARVGDADAEETVWRAAAVELAAIGGAAFPWMDEVVAAAQEPAASRVAEVLASLDVRRLAATGKE